VETPEAQYFLSMVIWYTQASTESIEPQESPHRSVEHYVVHGEGRSVEPAIASQGSLRCLLRI
jgi:hypothetical protein